MASVPKSQYDALQTRHVNIRKSREREQRRCSKLEIERDTLRSRIAELEAREAALLAKLKVAEEVIETARGLSFGEDWNNGTHAKIYRSKLLEALDKIKEAFVPSVVEHLGYSPRHAADQACPKCCGKMKPGKAIAQTFTGTPEWPGAEAVTMSVGGPGKLIDCLKCEKCGHSVTTAGLGRTDPHRFMAIASKPHAQLAGEMADEIKTVIYSYEQKMPLALAVGVLRIVEKEILDAAS